MLLFLYFPVTCNPTKAVTLPNIGDHLCIGVPRRVTYPYLIAHPELVKADLGAWCVCERVPDGHNSSTPFEDHSLAARHEPSALKGWILEVLYCDPKGAGLFCGSSTRQGEVFACRDTSPIRNRRLLGPYSRAVPRALW